MEPKYYYPSKFDNIEKLPQSERASTTPFVSGVLQEGPGQDNFPIFKISEVGTHPIQDQKSAETAYVCVNGFISNNRFNPEELQELNKAAETKSRVSFIVDKERDELRIDIEGGKTISRGMNGHQMDAHLFNLEWKDGNYTIGEGDKLTGRLIAGGREPHILVEKHTEYTGMDSTLTGELLKVRPMDINYESLREYEARISKQEKDLEPFIGKRVTLTIGPELKVEPAIFEQTPQKVLLTDRTDLDRNDLIKPVNHVEGTLKGYTDTGFILDSPTKGPIEVNTNKKLFQGKEGPASLIGKDVLLSMHKGEGDDVALKISNPKTLKPRMKAFKFDHPAPPVGLVPSVKVEPMAQPKDMPLWGGGSKPTTHEGTLRAIYPLKDGNVALDVETEKGPVLLHGKGLPPSSHNIGKTIAVSASPTGMRIERPDLKREQKSVGIGL